jgi:hypothetical protein
MEIASAKLGQVVNSDPPLGNATEELKALTHRLRERIKARERLAQL